MANRKAILLGAVALVIVATAALLLGREDYRATEGPQGDAGRPVTVPD